jgi:hypothetical protein
MRTTPVAGVAAVIAIAVTVSLTLGLGACWSDDRPIQWTRPRSVLGPIPLKAHVAYVDSALDRVVSIDVTADAPVVSHTAIGRRALTAVPSASRHQLYVITRGEQAIHPGEIDQPPEFWVVDAQHPEAAAVAYPIGSPFDRIAVSPDGRLAIAYFSSGSAGGTDPDGFFRNPNELAVVTSFEIAGALAQDNGGIGIDREAANVKSPCPKTNAGYLKKNLKSQPTWRHSTQLGTVQELRRLSRALSFTPQALDCNRNP